MPSHDQITVKVHNFAKDFVENLNQKLLRHYKFNNETGIFDIAVYRLMLDAEIHWSDEKERDEFFESLLNDLTDLMAGKKNQGQDAKFRKNKMKCICYYEVGADK